MLTGRYSEPDPKLSLPLWRLHCMTLLKRIEAASQMIKMTDEQRQSTEEAED